MITIGNEAKRRIAVIESARGFAALYVFVSHVIMYAQLGTASPGANYFARVFGFGHQAVLLFFLLSGFSVHYASRERNLGGAGRREYFYLRFRRIYPLFVLAVLITVTIAWAARQSGVDAYLANRNELSSKGIVATLLFLTDFSWGGEWFPVFRSNGPLWSLSYEVVYYALYPLIWKIFRRWGMRRAFGFSVILSLTAVALHFSWKPNHISNVFSLYWLWCAGAWIAEVRATQQTLACSRGLLGFGVFVFIATAFVTEKFSVRFVADAAWGTALALGMISFQLPRSKRDLRAAALILAGTIAALAVAVYLHVPGNKLLLAARLVVAGLLLCAWVMLPHLSHQKVLCAVLKPFAVAGPFSYGLYVVHMPFLAIAAVASSSSGALVRGISVLLAGMFAFWLARLLELRAQPIFARTLDAVWKRTPFSRRHGEALALGTTTTVP